MFTRPFSFLPPHKRKKRVWLHETTFQGLPEESRDTYDHVKTALTERFEPASKHELYNAELQVRTRKPNEGWADFAEDLQQLTEKAFPDLDGQSQEQLALT